MRYIEILEGIDTNWSIKEKAKYIYHKIGKVSSYDERFEYGTNVTLLEDIYYRDIDLEKDEDTKLVCNSGNKLFLKLLQKLGIDAELIYKKPKNKRLIDVDDVALIFYDEDGNKYYTNLMGDLENCKYGLETVFFGSIINEYSKAQDVKEISREEKKQIDEKIGYLRNGEYSDIVFKLINNEVKNTNNFKKFLNSEGIDTKNLSREQILRFKIKYITNLIRLRDETVGPSEIKQFYRRLFNSATLDKFESKIFKTYQFSKQENDEVDIVLCLSINVQDEMIYYVFSEDEHTYIPISCDELLEKVDGYKEKAGKILVVNKPVKDEEEEDIEI